MVAAAVSLELNFKLTISVCTCISSSFGAHPHYPWNAAAAAASQTTPLLDITTSVSDSSCGQVPKSNLLDYKVTKNADNLTESSSVGIYYMVMHSTFIRGRVKVSTGCRG